MKTQEQIDLVTAALQPLYTNPAFSTMTTDFVVEFSQLPVSPVPTDESIDIVKP